jgi:tetratricopeptide (TPR) repeat protein
VSLPTIFISYRREDASADAGRIRDWLLRQFGEERVFFDVDSIRPGSDFHRELEHALRKSSVFLPVIGRSWLGTTSESGIRRLDDPTDFVRVEIGSALARADILLIPVLVQGAEIPRAEELPPDLQDLVKRQVCRISHEHFGSDMRRLIQVIERAHSGVIAETAPPEATAPTAGAARSEEEWRTRLAAVEMRRKHQFADHLSRAETAFAAADYETTMAACEDAALIDPQDPRVQALMARTRHAIDERDLQAWIADAKRHLEAGKLAEASAAIDEALTRHPGNVEASTLRSQLLQARRERDRQRQRDDLLRPLLGRVRPLVEQGRSSEALAIIGEVLTIDPTHKEALELRERAAEAEQEREHKADQQAKAVQATPKPAVAKEETKTSAAMLGGFLVIGLGLAIVGVVIYFVYGPVSTAVLFVIRAYSSLIDALANAIGGWLAAMLPDSDTGRNFVEGVTGILRSFLLKLFLFIGLVSLIVDALTRRK